MDLTATLKRTSAVVLATAIGTAVLAAGLVPAANAAIGPKVIKATKTKGIRSIGNLKLDRRLTLADVKARVGDPKQLNRKTCDANYGAGLTLTFVSFGGETDCDKMALQVGSVDSNKWKVLVGKVPFRKGMSARRIPSGAKKSPGYGYELASMPFVTGRTGSVFAKVGGAGKISSIKLFIGGAGD